MIVVEVKLSGEDAEEAQYEIGMTLEDLRDSGNYDLEWEISTKYEEAA